MAKYRLHFIADTHAGSTVGPAPETIPHPEGASISCTPTSRWIREHYVNHLDREAEETKEQAPDETILIFNGDIMDGLMHHNQVQLYHPEPQVEKWLSEWVVEQAIAALEPDYIFIVLGTPSHVGRMGSSEESVGKALAAQYGDRIQRPDEYRYGWPMLRLHLDGHVTDIRHHGKLGQLPHTRESYQKRYAFDVWSSQAMYKDGQPANLAVRAHRHKYADSGPVPPHKQTTRLISLPCYQMSNDWAMSRAFEEWPDIGMCGVTLKDGQVRDVFPQVVYPTMEDRTWSP